MLRRVQIIKKLEVVQHRGRSVVFQIVRTIITRVQWTSVYVKSDLSFAEAVCIWISSTSVFKSRHNTFISFRKNALWNIYSNTYIVSFKSIDMVILIRYRRKLLGTNDYIKESLEAICKFGRKYFTIEGVRFARKYGKFSFFCRWVYNYSDNDCIWNVSNVGNLVWVIFKYLDMVVKKTSSSHYQVWPNYNARALAISLNSISMYNFWGKIEINNWYIFKNWDFKKHTLLKNNQYT